MNKLLSVIFLVAAVLSHNAHAEKKSDGTEGHGGDALRELFERARMDAAAKVLDLNWCSFPNGTPQPKIEWVLKNQSAIARDIQSADHRWVVDTQSTCGFTKAEPKAPIYLSYPTCASTVGSDPTSALFVLLHETGHHLGMQNEKEADEFARLIMSARMNAKCPQSPDITNPRTCSSGQMTMRDAQEYFANPGDTEAEGQASFKTYGRISRCVALTGCEPWKEWVPVSVTGLNLTVEPYRGSFSSSFPTWDEIEKNAVVKSGTLGTMRISLAATDTDPFFKAAINFPGTGIGFYLLDDVAGFSAMSHEEIMKKVHANMTKGSDYYYKGEPITSNEVRTVGPSYRGQKLLTLTSDHDSGLFRKGKDCLWNKWAGEFDLGQGVKEKVEFYFHGVFGPK